ncbi:hypothetical protein MOQ72_25755 [Saccharopolyspora sp. K220]|uniref:hypothetical protein n=1 Tax=Saccharopolyspora soli TaxID=2926618 RepID=UPI001F570F2A|nr:hypothetical protein [Saccharopolyspora soli]MCI2420860.1 hypothetical protein [Saccharopolyspora soli]
MPHPLAFAATALTAGALVLSGCSMMRTPEETAYEIRVVLGGPAGATGTLGTSTNGRKESYPEKVTLPYDLKSAPMGGPASYVVTPDDPAVAIDCTVSVEGEVKVSAKGQPGKPTRCDLNIGR